MTSVATTTTTSPMAIQVKSPAGRPAAARVGRAEGPRPAAGRLVPDLVAAALLGVCFFDAGVFATVLLVL